jgi:MFS family permease
MSLSAKDSRSNFKSFIWHSAFLALAGNFMDIDTIIPSMIIKVGGNAIHLGLLTAIMIGGSGLFQLVFAGWLSRYELKKKYLLIGINLRIAALLGMAVLFILSAQLNNEIVLLLIFVLIAIFSFSGSFAGVSYTDILGKSVLTESRKRFFSSRQVIDGIGILASAMVVRKLLTVYEFPENYSLLFLIAGVLLATASLGFWRLREVPNRPMAGNTLMAIFRSIPGELRNNSNLKYYLLVVNSLGLGLSILPFFILFAKEQFGLSYHMIGNILLLRVIGMLIAGSIMYRLANRFRYQTLLIFSLILSASLPLLILLFRDSIFWFQSVFVLSGIFVAVYKVTINGVLLEISTDDNRAVYAGISGAGNIMTTLFPLFAGALIAVLGYFILFPIVSVFILVSYLFVKRMDCRPQP